MEDKEVKDIETLDETVKEESKEEVKEEVKTEVGEEPKTDDGVKKENSSDTSEKEPKKKSNKSTIIILILLILAIAGGSIYLLKNGNLSDNSSNNNTGRTDVDSKKHNSPYYMSGNGLEAFDMAFLGYEGYDKNVVYSPLSIKYAMEMLADGAKGETKEQITSVLGEYEARSHTNNEHMSFANAMFIRNTFADKVLKEYTTDINHKYNAEIVNDNFDTPDNINNWISQKTFNLINNMVSQDQIRETDFFLINALAIDMEWNNIIQATNSNLKNEYVVKYDNENYSAAIRPIELKFGTNENKYQSLDFNNGAMKANAVEIGASINRYDIVKTLGKDSIENTLKEEYDKYLAEGSCPNKIADWDSYVDNYIKELDGNYGKVDVSTDFYFYDDDSFKAFAKDLKTYGDTTLQYIGIMPKTDDAKANMEKDSYSNVSKVVNGLKEIKAENFKEGVVTKITGMIPLFNFDYELDLENDFKKMGITNIFDINKSDLSGMIKDEKKYIEAGHKANIEFSNDGIKAAAVTTLGGRGSASECHFTYSFDVPVEEINLTFDKPYIFLIRDVSTGEVWFVGNVVTPSVNNN